ncbi:hypothetical protein [uncultured marine virus]|uniref:ATP-dependent helicase Rep n=1 Tax=uncultured marine virus TaxID=186617 RepID=S4TDT8_9VIRU|nr:hypothetical protein [uncultured marine virus]
MTPPPQSRSWVFTLNNPTEDERGWYEEWVAEGHATYVVCGEETGDAGTPHLQGFVQWTARRRMAYCKVRYPRAHWEVSRARDPAKARDYCQKDGVFAEYGIMAEGGHDNIGLARKRCYDAFKVGGAAAAEEAEPLVYAYQGHNLAKNVVRPAPHRPDITARWLFGPSGSGKTRKAWARWAEEDSADPAPYAKISTVKWWNGYRGEKTVIIDDLTKGGLGLHHLLTWCDRYPTQVETKGGMEPLYATEFIITSNYTPEEVFPDAGAESVVALRRRFTFEHITLD